MLVPYKKFLVPFFLIYVFYTINAQDKRPNIIVILADDMGYSDIGCYGGEIDTPNINNLASNGLRYKQFYNAARCCPTRAALMTGVYPHQAGMGWMAAADLGTPEYAGNLNNTSVTIAEVLKSAGYKTYMTGKWHLTNDRKTRGEVKDNWPKQRGFDHYFGIIPGGANYFTPTIYSGNKKYQAPDDFYLTNAISDTSVAYIDKHFNSEEKKDPMFMYVAYTSPHWPLHALQKDIDKYRETYKIGWDSLRKQRFEKQKALGLFSKNTTMNLRDEEIPAWDDVPPAKKEEMAMRMAIYAAQVDIMDQGIGRIVSELKQNNALENTLIFFLSDNGACAEFISSGKSKKIDGTADTFESYRINWANVSSTPFKEYKHYTYEGGIATPMIAHWPKGIKKNLNGGFANSYGEIMDIMATCVEVANTDYPKEFKGHQITPKQGKSLVGNFSGEDIERGKIFWEHEANIALRDGKWKMVAKTEPNNDFSKSSLRLYDLEADPTEMNDLTLQYPEKLQKMFAEWHSWGEKIKVFPMDTRIYNARQNFFKRKINGEFDDYLGDWQLRKSKEVEGNISVDKSGILNGENSALVQMKKPDGKFDDLAMKWRFPATKGEKLSIKFKSKSKKPTGFTMQLEKIKGNDDILIKKIDIAGGVEDHTIHINEIPEAGNYKLAFYFGELKAGEKVWIDGIKIISN